MLCRHGICFSLFVFLQYTTYADPQQDYAEEHCGDSIHVNSSRILVIGNWSSLPVTAPCYVEYKLEAPSHRDRDARGQVTILMTSLPGPPCDKSRLDVFDSNNVTQLSDPHGICGDSSGEKLLSSRNRLFIAVSSNDTKTWGDLQLLITSFNTDVCDTRYEFACNNRRCVSKEVTCDGYNDCGDGSEESDGCLLSPVVIAVIASLAGLLLIAVVIMSVRAVKKKQNTMGWGTGPGGSLIGSINDDNKTISSDKPIYSQPNTDNYGTLTSSH